MTAVPKDTLLGLIKWTFTGRRSSDMNFRTLTSPALVITLQQPCQEDPITIHRKGQKPVPSERAAGGKRPRPYPSTSTSVPAILARPLFVFNGDSGHLLCPASQFP